MSFTNSPLVSYTKISPNRTVNRNHAIDTITIHCVVGQCSVETLGNIFAPQSRQASSNYGIGTDGRIGMYCEEKDRSWCSSNGTNDHRAITIEVASDTTHPYAVNDKAYAALIDLCTDICKRNGIKKLLWRADKSLIGQVDKQNMTVHRWFANTQCPGDYLYNRHGAIAEAVNKRLSATDETDSETDTNTAKATTSTDFPGTLTTGYYRVRKTWEDTKSQLGAYRVLANAKAKVDENPGYTVYSDSGEAVYPQASFEPYLVKVSCADLNIRTGPGTNYPTIGKYTGKGIFTIVKESSGTGASLWGKLKSGLGWIALDYTTKV